MTRKSSKITDGWGWPLNSNKAHYFVDGRSLCAKWLFRDDCAAGTYDSPNNCKECARRLQKEAAKN